ncbi:MAG: hypothetical protein AAF549_05745 [Pseudomonadota bacterium]
MKLLRRITLAGAILASSQAYAQEDNPERLSADVRDIYTHYSSLFRGPMALAAGIPLNFACGSLSDDMESIKLCLNGLKSVSDDFGGLDLEEWSCLRDRWRVLNNQRPLANEPCVRERIKASINYPSRHI